jgi:hypothetical protein
MRVIREVPDPAYPRHFTVIIELAWPTGRAAVHRSDELVSTMTDAKQERIAGLLHEAGETHHRVFRIVDGADDDWASWYADWLVKLSELPALLDVTPVRSELVYLLVSLDRHYVAERPDEPWESYYARGILDHFRPGNG